MQADRPSDTTEVHLDIDTASQRLTVLAGSSLHASFPISTSPLGLGCEEGSLRTPSGRFVVVEKIGHGMPLDTVFKGRVPLKNPASSSEDEGDLVVARILRLHGTEPANANTLNRFIYIHGTNQHQLIGSPAGHGCIRMLPADVATLFDLVPVGAQVVIH